MKLVVKRAILISVLFLAIIALVVTYFKVKDNKDTEEVVVESTIEIGQPYGTLHGGASLALAESLAGHGSLEICNEHEIAFGMQVSGNHIRPVKIGNKVLASGKLTHKGSNTHIWDITLTTTEGKLVASIRVVNYIKSKK